MRQALKRILVTAGPTRESLDPVRYLSNHSTGEMGYAVAREARQRGCQVTLISGPVALEAPAGVKMVRVTSALEMERACKKYLPVHDALVMSAAVCDFRPQGISRQKMKRHGTLQLTLEKTPDILAALAKQKKNQVMIGFCLETEHWLSRARLKLTEKKLDGIVANRLSSRYSPFGRVRADVAFLDGSSPALIFKAKAKKSLARSLLNWMEQLQCQKAVQKN
ncbi:MAG: phosphopantothenoylcysteine decarboxylase [Candidatus Omnitrophica bacterium]|nr:phosphopantothenoylcysteine decarboxylase [Candidatus Omnitrophota bacterium]